MSAVSEKLNRIKRATDTIRNTVGASDTNTIEEVAEMIETQSISLVEHMKIIDLYIKTTQAQCRVYHEQDYTDEEVAKVQNLLNKLGGN